MKSIAQLNEVLPTLPGCKTAKRDNPRDLPHEVYGRKAFAYIFFESQEARKNGERLLKELGFSCNPGYCRESGCTEVRVAWFKGWHWDE